MSKHQFLLPFEVIGEQPLLFTQWVIVAVFIGLAGFWLPMILQVAVDGVKVGNAFSQLIRGAVLPGFGVVFVSSAMAEALVGTKTSFDADTTTTLSNWRAIVRDICLIVILLQGGLLARNLHDGRSGLAQLVLLAISLVLGVYLYCLRYCFSEPVERYVLKDNLDVKRLGDEGKKPRHDGSGVKL